MIRSVSFLLLALAQLVPNPWTNTFLENWKWANLTNLFQTPAFTLGPNVIVGLFVAIQSTTCFPRELYVLFVKYYLIGFVSMKNKPCGRWSASHPTVCTSQKVNKCLLKLKTAGCKSDEDKNKVCLRLSSLSVAVLQKYAWVSEYEKWDKDCIVRLLTKVGQIAKRSTQKPDG